MHTTLDPLLAALTRDYVDDEDLTVRLQTLFKARGAQRRVMGWTGGGEWVEWDGGQQGNITVDK